MKIECPAQISDQMGITVLGERGQVVIPKDIRKALNLETGAKLIVMTHENEVLMMMPVQKMKTLLASMNKKFVKLGTLINSKV